MNLFEHAAEVAKREAMTRVEANAKPEWKDQMLELVRLTCLEQYLFTSDDVFERYEALPDAPKTHEGRAFGPVMTQAAKLGYCRKTDRVRDSNRASLHKSPRAIWESLIYVR